MMSCKVKSFHIDAETRSDAKKNAKELDKTNERPESLKSFLMETTLHGVRFVFAESFLRRCLWSLLILASFAYCLYLVYGSFHDFLQWPFNTKITSKSAFEYGRYGLTFPAVTLCNFNSINMKTLRRSFENDGLNKEEIDQRIKDTSKVLRLSEDAMTDEFQKKYPEFFNREIWENTLKIYSHQIDEMLLPNAPPTSRSCSFDGLLCGAENFSSFTSSSFGQCFTFNSGKNGSQLLKATMAGKNNGLKLRLNLQRDGYLTNPIHPFIGITVLVHDQKTFPFMDEYGFAVEPGSHTFCSIKMKKIINLHEPYATNCTQRRLHMFKSGISYAYSKPACLMQCRNAFVIKKCKCTLMEFQVKAPVCAANDTFLCVYPALDKFSSTNEGRKCEKDCPQPCQHVEYEASLSYARLQKDVFVEELFSFVNGTMEATASSSLSHTYRPFLNMTKSEMHRYIEENIVSLDIYFKDLNYDEFEQVPTNELWNLFASVGGNFGLFLGMSSLTVCEFLDYGVRKIYHKIFHKKDNI